MKTKSFDVKKLAAVLLTSAGLALSPAAQADTSWQWARFGDAEVTLAKGDAGWQVVESGKTLPLSDSSRIDHLTVGADAWWASAVEDREDGERMVLVKGTQDGVEALPAPKVAPGSILFQPTMMVGAEGLEGVIWIEGEDRQSGRVQAARWTGGGWSQPVTVSKRRDGTQIALQAVRLEDGSYLAAWSGYDGEDDEIFWSRFNGSAWTVPATLSANAVPDITPTLRAMPGGGALVVWSAYDGNDYRIYSAVLADGRWHVNGPMGERSSIFPRFADTESNLLVYQQGAPQGWVVAELDSQGRIARSTLTGFQRPGPMVKAKTESGIELLWLGTALAKDGTKSMATKAVALPWQTSVD